MTQPTIKTEYPTLATPLTLLFNLLVVVWWLEIGLRRPVFDAIRLEFCLAALCALFAILRYQGNRAKRTRSNRDIAVSMVVFVAVGLGSLPFAFDIGVAWIDFFNRVVKYAILGALVSQYVVSPKTLSYYLFTTFLAFMKIGQEAFVGKVTGNQVWENQGVMRLHGMQGTMFGDPNSLSGKTVSTFPFLWFLFPTVREKWIKALILLQIVFAINIIVFTASRTGYVTFIINALLIVAFSRNRLRILMIALIAAVIAVQFIPQQYQDRFMSSFTQQEKEGKSSETRIGLVRDSLHVFAEHPLGVGLSCFALVQLKEGRWSQPTHNLYTQILAETGIQGAFAFALLVTVTLRKTLKVRKTFGEIIRVMQERLGKEPDNQPLLQAEITTNKRMFAAATALASFILLRLALGVFGHDLLEIYWWIAAGLAMALNNILETAEKRAQELVGYAPAVAAPRRRRTVTPGVVAPR